MSLATELRSKILALQPGTPGYVEALNALRAFLETTLKIPTSPLPETTPTSWKSKFWIGLGVVGGGLLLWCDSFSNMAMIMGAFLTVGNIIFAASLGFAVLTFLGFLVHQLVSLARTEQTPWLKMPEKLKQYMAEKEALMALALILNHPQYCMACFKGTIDFDTHKSLIAHMQDRFSSLKETATTLNEARNTVGKKIRNYVVLACTGLWVFSSGFSIALYGLSSLLALFSIAIPLAGLAGFGAVMGMVALLMFWVGQREELVQTLDRLSGIDEKWIETLSSSVNLATIQQEYFGCHPEAPYVGVDPAVQRKESDNDDLSEGLQALPFYNP